MNKSLVILLVLCMIAVTPAFATVVVDSPEIPAPPPEIEEIIEELQTVYRLTIYYIYEDGSTAAATYTEQLNAGDTYSVSSPSIPGYTPSVYVVSGTMPARDIEYTVIYVPIPTDPDGHGGKYLTLEDYETPLGLGETSMNVGICIE